MFLKSLQILGFKSFADRTVLEFHPGMTAIVGPNGCGKSNVLDAIRWVLGEQSAKALRGSTMQDIIFGGTDGRKALSMAEVSLTFGNCEKWLGTDYHEVTVTRRAFRDDQSEYEINQTPCRLRDVHQLFMDTGIGRAAYSIMEQGKIDAILSSRPEDRRAIFEEAAGITRFKIQKKDAMRKLELVDGNLLRLGDVIREVERQMSSLQRQAAKARRYQEMANQLKGRDLQLASLEFEKLKQSLTQKEERVAALQMELAELEQTLEQKQSALRQRRGRLEELENQLHHVIRQRDQIKHEKAQAEREVEHSIERTAQWQAFIERSQAEIESIQKKIEVQQAQVSALEEQILQVSEQQKRTAQVLEEIQAEFDSKREKASQFNQRREALDQALIRAQQAEAQAQSELMRLEEHEKNHVLRIEKLATEQESAQSQRAEQEKNLESILLNLEALKKEREEMKNRLIAAQNEAKERSASWDAFRKMFLERQSVFTQIEARTQALRRLVESENNASALPAKWFEERRGKGIISSLIEQMRVEPGYEKALEKALGIACEAWMVENADLLEKFNSEVGNRGAIVWIDSNLVQAESFQAATPSENSRKEAVYHFIQADSKYRSLFSRLLENWYIAEDAVKAQELKREMPQANVVSLTGEIWHGLGWQLRGTPKAGVSSILLERKNELIKLEGETLQAAQDVQDAKEKEEHARKEKEAAENSFSNVRIQNDTLHARLLSLQHEEELVRKKIDQYGRTLQTLNAQIQTLRDSLPANLDSKEKLQNAISRAKSDGENARQEITALAEEFTAASKEADMAAQRVMEARIQAAASAQHYQALINQQRPLALRIEELMQQSENLEEQVEKDRASIQQAEERMRAAQDILAHSDERILSIEQTIEELEKERKREIGHLEDFESSLQDERRQASSAQSAYSEEQVILAQDKMRLERIVERIRDSYQTDLEEYVRTQFTDEMRISEEEQHKLQTLVAELRAKLDQMGPVNLEAIQEFEELSERDLFLKKQKEDLERSKQELMEAIRRMDMTTQTMFAETFEAINKNFSETFVELFGGGRAALNLVDENNPLESGIEIVAKPPGKQLQNLSLLSGGEKTMTAVALLFSIYKVKPSPFCILDEMDAPLDESNISRFVKMLQGFLKQSQFIVITHNKRTIAACDILYGVTMQEHGVSKIVSVQLARKEERPLFEAETKSHKDSNAEDSSGLDEETDSREDTVGLQA